MSVDETTFYDTEGVVATVVNGVVNIRLPQITSIAHCLAVIGALREIYETAKSSSQWVVNASDLTSLPMLLVSVFVAFDDEFHAQSRQFMLVGVRPELYPPPHIYTGRLFESDAAEASTSDGPSVKAAERRVPLKTIG